MTIIFKNIAKGLGWCAGMCAVTQIPPTTIDRMWYGAATFEYRLIVKSEQGRWAPRAPNESLGSGDRIRVELRSEQGGPVYIWVTSSHDGVQTACPGGPCEVLPPNTHRLVPEGTSFQLDPAPARESILVMVGAPERPPVDGAGRSVAEFKQDLLRESGACEAVMSGPAGNDYWAQARSRCEGRPVLIEAVIQHPE